MASLLATTNQASTLRRMGVSMGLCFASASVAPLLLAQQRVALAMVLFVVGALGLVGCAFYIVRAVRCPSCGCRWVEHALGEVPMGTWLHWLMTFDACPQCGKSTPEHEGEE